MNEVGITITMMDRDMAHRAARPGGFGGPEKLRSSDTGTQWTDYFFAFCLLRVLFAQSSLLEDNNLVNVLNFMYPLIPLSFSMLF